MIAWLMTNWMTQLATVVFAIWFARGVWKATMRPRLTYVSHSEVREHGTLLTVKRQELLPPWRTLEETWLLKRRGHVGEYGALYDCAIRESDGKKTTMFLSDRLFSLAKVRDARDAETDELLKQEAGPH